MNNNYSGGSNEYILQTTAYSGGQAFLSIGYQGLNGKIFYYQGGVANAGTSVVNTGNWVKADLVFVSSSQVILYVNGKSEPIAQPTGAFTLNSSVIRIGKLDASQIYNGLADELRESNVIRSASWIATEYANQNAPSTFESIAGEETQAVTTFNSTWYSSAWGIGSRLSLTIAK